MNEQNTDFHRQQQQYWKEMTFLKADAAYIRLYRDQQGRWGKRLGTLKAVASGGSILAWASWKELAFVWGAVIAAAQIVDALRDEFPFSKKA